MMGVAKARHRLSPLGRSDGLIPATAKKPHPTPPRRAFPRRNEEKQQSHSAETPRDGPRSGGDGTDGTLLRDSFRQSLRRAPSSITFSQRTLDRVARAKHGRRDRWDRAYCYGGSPRVRCAIFGWPASAE